MYWKNALSRFFLLVVSVGINFVAHAEFRYDIKGQRFLTQALADDGPKITGESTNAQRETVFSFKKAFSLAPKKDSEDIYFAYVAPLGNPFKFEFGIFYFDSHANPGCKKIFDQGFWKNSSLLGPVSGLHIATQYYFGPPTQNPLPSDPQSHAYAPLKLVNANVLTRLYVPAPHSYIYFLNVIRIESDTTCSLSYN